MSRTARMSLIKGLRNSLKCFIASCVNIGFSSSNSRFVSVWGSGWSLVAAFDQPLTPSRPCEAKNASTFSLNSSARLLGGSFIFTALCTVL
ncbi:Uncharacterised protein [Vibrio cholerae]|nr:Uncharacterised protein [Vibrio cholerae]